MEIEYKEFIVQKKTLSNGETKEVKYILGRKLGKGGFASCFQVTREYDGLKLACKLIEKKSLLKARTKKKLLSEIKIHKALKNEHIVKFDDYFEDDNNIYILLELCEYNTLSELHKFRNRLTELEVMYYMQQILFGLKYLHNHSIIHRDLKLGNIFINDKMRIKIGDFGLAAKLRFKGELRKTVCGTPNYIAPEIIDGKDGHSFEADIWSLGIIIYSLLIGKPPFETQEHKTTYKRIKMNAYSFPEGVLISHMAKELITQILVKEPSNRLTIDNILKHDFFSQGTIPKSLPQLTLEKKPADTFIRSYIPDIGPNGIVNLRNSGEMLQINYSGLSKINTKNPQMSPVKENILTPNFATTDAFFPSKNTFYDQVWIKKFVDYSSKYGIGYYLTNGMYGVYFNDSSKIVYDSQEEKIIYIDRKGLQQLPEIHAIDRCPESLDKKVKLLLHFKQFLEHNMKLQAEVYDNYEKIFVKNWVKTKQAYVFKLTNRLVQFIFNDGSEIVLSIELKKLLFVTTSSERTVYDLNVASQSENLELTKRLKYVKNVLIVLSKKSF